MPQQSWQPSIEAMQLQTEVDDQESGSCELEYEGEHRWTARDRMVTARMEEYLNENDNMRVDIEELEFLLDPEDSEVDLRQILGFAWWSGGGRIFEIFSSKGQSVPAECDGTSVKGLLVTQEEEPTKKEGATS